MVYSKDCAGWQSARSFPIVFFLSLSVAACGGGSSGNRTAQPGSEPSQQPPSLSFSAASTAVAEGGSTTLSWTASRASSCDASGGWSGSRAVSGSEQVGPIDSDTVFRLNCSGAGGAVTREVRVTVGGDAGPAITLRAQPEQVPENGASTLDWTVANATRCQASGGWSGERPTSGSFGTGQLTQTTSYSLSCEGPDGNALASVTVEVLDKVLRWRAPTQNVDGSPLTDLAGFVVYWGSQSRSYGSSFAINDPDATRWEADIAPGTYYFALTAVDGDGNESGYSNEVRKTIP